MGIIVDFGGKSPSSHADVLDKLSRLNIGFPVPDPNVDCLPYLIIEQVKLSSLTGVWTCYGTQAGEVSEWRNDGAGWRSL